MIVRVSPGSPSQWKATFSPLPASTCRSTQLYGDVELPADEPLRERRLPVQDRVPLRGPGQPLGLIGPERQPIRVRPLVRIRLDVGGLRELLRGLEPAVLLEQVGECRVARLGHRAPPGGPARHWAPSCPKPYARPPRRSPTRRPPAPTRRPAATPRPPRPPGPRPPGRPGSPAGGLPVVGFGWRFAGGGVRLAARRSRSPLGGRVGGGDRVGGGGRSGGWPCRRWPSGFGGGRVRSRDQSRPCRPAVARVVVAWASPGRRAAGQLVVVQVLGGPVVVGSAQRLRI